MSSEKTELLEPLQIIRTETVLSKLPIHSLSKQKKTKIQISKKNAEGQLELYWEVSHNEKYGPPGELAYKIDTIIINKRIEEVGRPIPEKIRAGSQNEICEELGLKATGKNRTNVKNALRQNAGALITAKLDYKGRDGREYNLEADFTRYSVVFTGEKFSDGKKADAVYIIPNGPYREVLNNAPVRPLDYEYLKALPPSAQRFYEIVSYRIFAAIKYQHPYAKLLYSEYCVCSAQNRYYDYDHFKKQMYKVHKPHIALGYIERVEYEEGTDSEGKQDWIIYYYPGRKARAEYKAFNGKSTILDVKKERSNKALEQQPVTKTQAPKQSIKPSASSAIEPGTINGSAALELVQYFHKLARNLANYQPTKGSKELTQAEAMIQTYGLEKAKFIVAFASSEAKKTNFSMRTIGAILQYVSDAIQQYERREEEQHCRRAQEEAQCRQEKQRQDQMEARLKAIPRDEYRARYDKVKAEIVIDVPAFKKCGEEVLKPIIHSAMIRELDKQERETNNPT